MQKMNDDPVWDLVICITTGVGSVVWLVWASLMLNNHFLILWDNRISALACLIMAFFMLSTAISYWHTWRRRR